MGGQVLAAAADIGPVPDRGRAAPPRPTLHAVPGGERPMPVTNTDRILDEMFDRLLNIELPPELTEKLVPVVDGVIERMQSRFDPETVQGQNMLRALLASMVAHGWGLGMHPHNNPAEDRDGRTIEVRVCKDILLPLQDLKSIRYIKKDPDGRVKKALFEPDQNARIRQHIDAILSDVSSRWEE
jgi:hypothetical protein